MKPIRLTSILILTILICTRTWAYFPGQEKITDPSLIGQTAKGSIRVIVTLSGYEDFKDSDIRNDSFRIKAFQSKSMQLQEKVISKMGTLMKPPDIQLENLPIFSTVVFKKGLKALAAMEEVAFIEEDRNQELHTSQGISLISPGKFRTTHGGSGVAVAIVDSGINYRHPALGKGGFPNAKVIGGRDFGDNDADPMYKIGHGTSCASVAAGNNTRTSAYIGGVAPDAKIYALKVAQSDGGIPTSAIIGAWDWCVSHQHDDPENPIMIISTSLGTPMYHSGEYCDNFVPAVAATAARAKAGSIAIFVSSGNEGMCDGISFSACLENTISVGAVYDSDWGSDAHCRHAAARADQVICYSNSANILDMLAPSACAYAAGCPGNTYQKCFNGTSAACPYAAGAAAVIQSYFKDKTGKFLSVDQLRQRMKQYGNPIRDPRSGITFPRVNIRQTISSGNTDDDGDEGDSQGTPLDELRDILRDAR